ncbi:MAG: T9SS type A sorting domain-containing protein [Bacteroidales bacterium]|nr:T9SS type A sorting domain-containing protein [Bacteroidales bacterium]
MRQITLKIISVTLLGLVLTGLKAQESVTSTGGNVTGSGGSVSYSVGQIAYQTYTGTSGSLSEGVLQPYEISVISEIKEATGIGLLVLAYPNPTTDLLILEVNEFELSNFNFQLFDIKGKLLNSDRITSNKTSILTENLSPATYIVKVFQDNKVVKTFKVIKK